MDAKREPSMGEILTSLRRIVPARADDDHRTALHGDTGTAAQSDTTEQEQSAGRQTEEARARAERVRPRAPTIQPSLPRRSEGSRTRENSLSDVLHAILRQLEQISDKSRGTSEHNPVTPTDNESRSSQIDFYREHVMKELTTQVDRITEEISKQGRKLTIALGASDRNMLDAFEALTSSLIKAFESSRSAATEDLARVDAHLAQLNESLQSRLARPVETVSTAEAELSQAIAARQRSLEASSRLAGHRAAPFVADPPMSGAAAKERGASLFAGERKAAESGSAHSGGACSSIDPINERLEAISQKLKTINKLWDE